MIIIETANLHIYVVTIWNILIVTQQVNFLIKEVDMRF